MQAFGGGAWHLRRPWGGRAERIMRSNSQGWSGGPRERKPGTGADCAVVERRSVCRVRRIRFRHRCGYGTLISCSGSFLAVKTDGEVVLFRDGGKGPEILARTRPLPGTLRALPALASGRLYLRDDRTLVALDVGPAPAARP